MSIYFDDKYKNWVYNTRYMDSLTTKTLLSLGFSDNEIRVYLVLLKSGLSQAGPIVKEAKLHRMLVYNALDTLVREGLAQVTRKKSIKLFSANDPQILIEKSRHLFEATQQIVPELHKLHQTSGSDIDIRTLVGVEGFQTNLQEVVESAAKQTNKEMCIIGGAKDVDFYDAIGDWYIPYTKLLDKKGVSKKLLAPSSFSSAFKKKFAAEKGTELRTLPQGLSSPTYTRITKEIVSIEIYKPHIVIIQIRNRAIAQAYLDSFALLWKSI